jgi:uncharacterized protein (TIGR02186 family)
MRRALRLALAIAAAAPQTAAAADLVSGLSQDQIEITSNYTGTDLVVFGAIEHRETDAPNAHYNVIVVLRGPEVDMTVRQKARTAGLWINRHEVTLKGMPGYYYAASTGPLDRITSSSILERYELGVPNVEPTAYTVHTATEAQVYTDAAIRAEARQGFYKEAPDGVEFLSNSLFRVRVPVPAGVPRGQYTAEVYLFQNGNVLSAQSTPLFIDQTGLERQLFGFAHSWPLAYGIATVAMALMLGWMSSLVFRRP